MAHFKAKAVAIAARVDEAAHNKEKQALFIAYSFVLFCISALILL